MVRTSVPCWSRRRLPTILLLCLLLGDRSALADDAADIRARFTAAVAAYNAHDINTLMSYFSPNYLDGGETKADQESGMLNEWAENPSQQVVFTSIDPVTVNGSTATAVVNWVGEAAGTEYLVKEGGVWYLYGNQQKYDVNLHTRRQANHLWEPNDTRVDFQVEDPKNAITAVKVSGPGITGTISLNHQTGGGMPSWVSWSTGQQQNDKSPGFTTATRPAVGTVYTFTIHDASGTVTQTATITGYVDAFVTNLSPADGGVVTPATSNPTFSWIGLGGGYTYSVWCNDWSSDHELTVTSVVYGGSALVSGTRYQYQVQAHDNDWNSSNVTAFFVYTAGNKYILTTGADLLYTEDSGAVAIDPGLVLTNGSGLNIGGATVSLWNWTPGEDVLGFTSQNGITGSFSNSNLILSGTASTAAYQAALRSVTYTNTSHTPSPQPRFAVFQFSDTSAAQSEQGQRQIQITPVNDPPTLTTISTLTGALKDANFTITYSALLNAADAADPDGPTLGFRVEAVSSGTLTKNGGAVTPGTTVLAAGESLIWHPPTGATGVLNAFTVRGWDGALASTAAVQVKVQVLGPAAIAVTQDGNPVVNGAATPLSFGSVFSFSPAPELTFTIQNTGGAPLTVGLVMLDNDLGIAVSQQPTSPVNAGDTTTFRLQMQTGTPGTMSADVRFVNGDAANNPFAFKVSGTVKHGADTNMNGLDDAWETHWFGGLGVDPDADPDGDGWSNLQEFERRTDPTRYILSLKQGWNLVALARAPRNHSVDTLLGAHIVGPAWGWQNGRYETATELEPLRGYWVYATADADLEIHLP